MNGLFAHPLGKFVLFGYSWALLHHMLGRRPAPDLGYRPWHEPRRLRTLLCWLTIIGSLVLTALVWFAALSLRGSI